MKRAVVIGAGFGGMSAAAYLARDGYEVTVLERNDQPGGRAYSVERDGFRFELGPSWYMMPDVFDEFFGDFGHHVSDFYELRALLPSYRVFDGAGQALDIGGMGETTALFESVAPGAGAGLKRLLAATEREYRAVRQDILIMDWTSRRQALRPEVLKFLLNPEMVRSYDSRIRNYIKDERLVRVLEFMTVFMGGSPQNIPGMYSLLAYVDMGLGISYPLGGFRAVAQAFQAVGEELGVTYRFGVEATGIRVLEGAVARVEVAGGESIAADVVVANADYHHVQTKLLAPQWREIQERAWRRKTLSPSGLLLSLGVKGRLSGLLHHNLFFDTDWQEHFDKVFRTKVWSQEPLFYLCVPSKTDPNVAPFGHENLFVLAPQAAGVEPSQKELNATIANVVERIERQTGGPVAANVVTRDVRTATFFEDTFHAYQGNAFGLAHTLRQSALFRPPVKAQKVDGLYYAGQYTNPGTGVPMVVLSGKTVAEAVKRHGA